MSLLETSMAAWIKEDKLEMTMKIRLDCMPPCRTGSFGTDEMNVFRAGSRGPCFPGSLERIHSDNRDEAFDADIGSLDYLIQVMERLKPAVIEVQQCRQRQCSSIHSIRRTSMTLYFCFYLELFTSFYAIAALILLLPYSFLLHSGSNTAENLTKEKDAREKGIRALRPG
jgi:hypothetical protein